jgi:hypothetical protein
MFLLYGLEKDETREYMETLLASNCRDQADLDKITAHAASYGFHTFRVATYNGEAPDFSKTLNI